MIQCACFLLPDETKKKDSNELFNIEWFTPVTAKGTFCEKYYFVVVVLSYKPAFWEGSWWKVFICGFCTET